MKKQLSIFLLFFFCTSVGQVVLEANGPGNTYEEITAVLAPGYSPIEAPGIDNPPCTNHGSFGNHIDEVYDNDLGDYTFRFLIHVNEDNDRCLNFDRQRNEIKSYDKSPDNLLGVEGEKVVYKWAFKLADGFQSSSSFTHIHQLKSVGGSYSSMPIYTLTTRKSSPDRLELRYAETTSQITLSQTPLSPLIDVWIEATEKIEYTSSGFYSIELVNKQTGAQLFYYDNSATTAPKINWRPGGEFVRPKWGIYRSLNSASDLRDEDVRFSYFSVEEVSSLSTKNEIQNNPVLYPNPTTGKVTVIDPEVKLVMVFDMNGKKIVETHNKVIDLSELEASIYFIKTYTHNNQFLTSLKVLKTY